MEHVGGNVLVNCEYTTGIMNEGVVERLIRDRRCYN